MTAPCAIQPLLTLASQLRHFGFAASPDQTVSFIEATGLLGPRSVNDIRHAAIALYAIPPEKLPEFDAIFKTIFYGLGVAAQAETDDDDVDAFEPAGGEESIDVTETESEGGLETVDTEHLQAREFAMPSDNNVLIDFQRKAKTQLPHRRSYRYQPARRAQKPDLRRTIKSAAKHDGEIIDLAQLRRKRRQRKILLLIDVSGSMKDRSPSSLRFAHSLVHSADSAEIFTLGTRLTRVTSALKPDDVSIALQRVTQLVADFDGGTRIGGALQAYLSIPKYAGFARGAAVVVLSDGLERGDVSDMVASVQKLSRLAWRLTWLSPLAADADYQPRTEALRLSLPFIDQLDDGDSIEAMCRQVLRMARTA